MRLSREEFAELVRRAVESLPEGFRVHLQNVSVEVAPAPTPEEAAELGGGPPGDLLGGYFGTPLTERSVSDAVEWPERIVIFQRNVERTCRTRRQVLREVRTTVLHEIAHHFGMDEQDLEQLGYQ